MMPRFVLLYIGRPEADQHDLLRIRADPRVTVLDQEGRRLLLVRCSEDVVLELMKELPLWRLAPEIVWRALGEFD